MRARDVSRPGPSAIPKATALGRDVAPQALRYARRVDQPTSFEAVVTENRILKIGLPKVALDKVGAAKICFRKIAALKRHVYESRSAEIRTGEVHVLQFAIAKRSRDQMSFFAGR